MVAMARPLNFAAPFGVDLDDGGGAAIPGGDGAVFRGEDELCGLVIGELKIGGSVEDLASGRAGGIFVGVAAWVW